MFKLPDRKSNLDETFAPKIIPNEALFLKQALEKLSVIQQNRKSLIRSKENQPRKMQNVIKKHGVKVDAECQQWLMKITNKEKSYIFD